ncbi:class I SAM-dependent rRNA methyltransferase [Candidatus Gracilibacteria bacterium]|nr:class I SAM-dependent rRNA methyltransferase [Candidatus Gracilibacteria bacterium]
MLTEISVPTILRAKLAQGHPWVYRNQVSGGEGLRSGSWVRVRCGGWSGIGLWDSEGAIAVRIFSRQQIPDNAWIENRVWDAWENRATLRATATNAYRWIFGEGDGLPGMVVDRYGDYAIIQTYAQSLATLVQPLAGALRRCDPQLRGVVARVRAAEDLAEHDEVDEERAGGLQLIWGERPPEDLVIQEHGLYFQANLYRGQKTGLFLDQRENRAAVERIAAGLDVLNCFAYTAAFSLYALRGDAAHVVSVDIGRGLEDAATVNLRLNNVDERRHDFITADCFAVLDSFAKEGRRFQLVILDPPSFARSKSNQHAALRAYTRINALALRCVEPGGLLATASCTSQVGQEAFRTMLAEAAAQVGCRTQIVLEAGQPTDHPVPAAFPEGRYLKFLIARVREPV